MVRPGVSLPVTNIASARAAELALVRKEVVWRAHKVIGGFRRSPEDNTGSNGRAEQHRKPGDAGEFGFIRLTAQLERAKLADHQHEAADNEDKRGPEIEPSPPLRRP
jgi:hypothetical protein